MKFWDASAIVPLLIAVDASTAVAPAAPSPPPASPVCARLSRVEHRRNTTRVAVARPVEANRSSASIPISARMTPSAVGINPGPIWNNVPVR